MEVTYLGMNCVRLTGRDIAALCDPAEGIKQGAEATLLSQEDIKVPEKAGMVIDGPGEYEIKGAMITGVPARLHVDEEGDRGTIYSVMIDGINVAYLGNIAPELSNNQIEALGQVDVLIIPVGGHGLTLDSVSASKIISQLEPKYVVPTHYDDGKTKYAAPQDKLEVFLKEIGSNPEPMAKLKVSSRDMPLETTIAVLQRAGA
ncbi:MAG TPA: MBL fold metallo-hydrolase [Candidatus Saccharimonadales bacterium]|nr:MBL fold metallo-hydrolase [Candidatus Saccharimonadales bacterium]